MIHLVIGAIQVKSAPVLILLTAGTERKRGLTQDPALEIPIGRNSKNAERG